MSIAAAKWLEQGRAKGRLEGKAEGRAEGRAEAKAETLLRQLRRRFGPLPEAARDRILAADLATLDLWLDRVLDAASLEEVLASSAT